jgi:hypothetical protein
VRGARLDNSLKIRVRRGLGRALPSLRTNKRGPAAPPGRDPLDGSSRKVWKMNVVFVTHAKVHLYAGLLGSGNRAYKSVPAWSAGEHRGCASLCQINKFSMPDMRIGVRYNLSQNDRSTCIGVAVYY